MTDAPITNPDETIEATPEPKARECLRCNAEFSSAWAGERICSRCKTSSAWRQGSPISSHTSSGQKR